MNQPLVFVDIDTQQDFLHPNGSLFIPESPAILGNLARLTRFALEHDIPIIATACSHEADCPEDDFPPHCLAGTPGQARVPETQPASTLTLEPHQTLPPLSQLPPHLTLYKCEYDIFSRRDADAIFAAYDQDNATFVVYGVATDYCVRCAVIGLLDRGRKVALVVDAIRAVNPEEEPAHLTEFVRRGAVLTLTDRICEHQPVR